MDPEREDFDTEAEAIAFVEGLGAAAEQLKQDPLTTDMFVDGDKWIVEYSVL